MEEYLFHRRNMFLEMFLGYLVAMPILIGALTLLSWLPNNWAERHWIISVIFMTVFVIMPLFYLSQKITMDFLWLANKTLKRLFR